MRTSPWSVAGLVARALRSRQSHSQEPSVKSYGLSSVFGRSAYSATGSSGTGQEPSQYSNLYDARARYEDPESDYDQPVPWFDGATQPAPIPTSGPIPQPECEEPEELAELVLDQDAELTIDMIRDVHAAVLQRVYGIDPDRIDEDALYEASVMTQKIFDYGIGHAVEEGMAQDALAEQAEAYGLMPDPAAQEMEPYPDPFDPAEPVEQGVDPTSEGMMPDQGFLAGGSDLGELVEDPMAQPAPDSLEGIVQEAGEPMMAEPEMMEQQMEDDPMQEMMDPFMMPGPFGPGPGP